jgi:hypothetical protein
LEASRENRLAAYGVPTTREFFADETVRLPVIQGVALVDEGFGQVQSITPVDEHTIAITGENGTVVHAKIDWKYLF